MNSIWVIMRKGFFSSDRVKITTVHTSCFEEFGIVFSIHVVFKNFKLDESQN